MILRNINHLDKIKKSLVLSFFVLLINCKNKNSEYNNKYKDLKSSSKENTDLHNKSKIENKKDNKNKNSKTVKKPLKRSGRGIGAAIGRKALSALKDLPEHITDEHKEKFKSTLEEERKGEDEQELGKKKKTSKPEPDEYKPPKSKLHKFYEKNPHLDPCSDKIERAIFEDSSNVYNFHNRQSQSEYYPYSGYYNKEDHTNYDEYYDEYYHKEDYDKPHEEDYDEYDHKEDYDKPHEEEHINHHETESYN